MDAFYFEIKSDERFLLGLRKMSGSFYPQFSLITPAGERIWHQGNLELLEVVSSSAAIGPYYLIIQDLGGDEVGEYDAFLRKLDPTCSTFVECDTSAYEGMLTQFGEYRLYHLFLEKGSELDLQVGSSRIRPDILLIPATDTIWWGHIINYQKFYIYHEAVPESGFYYLIVRDYDRDQLGAFTLDVTCGPQHPPCIAPTIEWEVPYRSLCPGKIRHSRSGRHPSSFHL